MQPTSLPAERMSRRPLIGIPAATLEPPPNPGALYFQFSGNYPAALAACGAVPVIIPLGLPDDILRDLFERLDGLLLAGGVDVAPAAYGEEPHPALGRVDPARDDVELKLARWALAADLPILGICRGIQSLNVAAGGTLYQDLAAQYPGAIQHAYRLTESPWERPTHRVTVTAGRLGAILGVSELAVNSFHHQAVKDPAPGFAIVARAEDGVIEGIERPAARFVIGVQWHPEGMFRTDPLARRLFAAFVEATGS
ncbi:MAG: gamma-glutamyl-gamma-aminobutyrate hydrolase family protein [Anaerolineae bacterium]|nr:gamma-glutamyl-gamma-aminobutyrate hydrolase family protein [Anaerolineae bacterium]